MIPAIEVRDVSFGHNGSPILDSVSLTVRQGDMYAVIGPNGGGKTTLLKIILGLLPAAQGTVSVFGNAPRDGRHLVGYVPQFRTFDFHYPITVREMVLSGRLSHARGIMRRYQDEDHEVTREVLEQLNLSHLSDRTL